LLSDGIDAGKVFLPQGLVDDDLRFGARAVGILEIAPTRQVDPHGLEVARRGEAYVRRDAAHVLPLDRDTRRPSASAQRQTERGGNRLDPRQCLELGDDGTQRLTSL